VFGSKTSIHILGYMQCLGCHLALLVVSSPLSTIFLIGCYSYGLFCVPLSLGTHERRIGSLVREHVLFLISSKS
jgi:hypothetical protein